MNKSKTIILEDFGFRDDIFKNQIKYCMSKGYEIYIILIGHISYDFSDRFNPRIFYGPFFGPYGDWINLIKPENIFYEYNFVNAYINVYKKFNLPLDRFKKNSPISISEYKKKLKIFGYLDYEDLQRIYENK